MLIRDLGLHLVGVIQCRGDLSKDLAGSVQFPRDLVRGRSSGPFVAVEPGGLAGGAVVERPELAMRGAASSDPGAADASTGTPEC